MAPLKVRLIFANYDGKPEEITVPVCSDLAFLSFASSPSGTSRNSRNTSWPRNGRLI